MRQLRTYVIMSVAKDIRTFQKKEFEPDREYHTFVFYVDTILLTCTSKVSTQKLFTYEPFHLACVTKKINDDIKHYEVIMLVVSSECHRSTSTRGLTFVELFYGGNNREVGLKGDLKVSRYSLSTLFIFIRMLDFMEPWGKIKGI